MQSAKPDRLPAHIALEIAVRAKTDPRTVHRVFCDPASAYRNAARARAAEELRAAGYLPRVRLERGAHPAEPEGRESE